MLRKIKNLIQELLSHPINRALSSLPNDSTISLVDIGAAGSIEPRWERHKKYIDYIGFEPDERSFLKMDSDDKEFAKYRILPEAIGAQNLNATINLCKDPQVSSVFAPNIQLVDLFPNPERFNVHQKATIKFSRLDSLPITSPDFIKLDIQGGELNALVGAENLMPGLLGVEVEVEFLHIYKDQPLFGDICNYLLEHNLQFMDFTSLVRWERSTVSRFGQCIFGDAIFLRSPENIMSENLSLDKISSYIGVCLIYRRFDLIKRMLDVLPNDIRNEFRKFEDCLRRARFVHNVATKVATISHHLVSIFGPNYRQHMIY